MPGFIFLISIFKCRFLYGIERRQRIICLAEAVLCRTALRTDPAKKGVTICDTPFMCQCGVSFGNTLTDTPEEGPHVLARKTLRRIQRRGGEGRPTSFGPEAAEAAKTGDLYGCAEISTTGGTGKTV